MELIAKWPNTELKIITESKYRQNEVVYIVACNDDSTSFEYHFGCN